MLTVPIFACIIVKMDRIIRCWKEKSFDLVFLEKKHISSAQLNWKCAQSLAFGFEFHTTRRMSERVSELVRLFEK